MRVEAYGTVDELNAMIGVAVAASVADELVAPLAEIQNKLFHLGAQLSRIEGDGTGSTGPRVTFEDAESLEKLMDALSESLDPLENFVLPGGTPAASQLHVARTVCRRAERLAVTLAGEEALASEVLVYLNRLSDALFVMARFDNAAQGVDDVLWDSRA